MFNLLQIKQDRGLKVAQAQNLVDRAEKAETGPRPMTEDEVKLFDSLHAEIKGLDARIAQIEEHEKRREDNAALVKALETPQGRRTAPDAPANGAAGSIVAGPWKLPATCRRYGNLKAFKGVVDGMSAEERAYRVGLWLQATVFRNFRAINECQKIGVALAPDIRGTLSTTSNPDGGFLVPDELANAIIDLREQFGVFRRECRVWPMGSDTLDIPARAGGITIGPLDENPAAAPTESSPTFGQRKLVAKKCGGLTKMSTEIAEDAVMSMADWVAQEFAYAFSNFEDTIGFTGNGTSTHIGVRGLTFLMTEAASLAGTVLAVAPHDTFAEIDHTDLSSLMAKLPQYAKMNAKFYCSSVAVELTFNRLKATAGGNTVQTLGGAPGDNYLGYPIVVSQVLPSITTAVTDGSPMIFFGDLSKSSALGDRRQVRVFPSEHRGMELDQVWILGTERIDILNHDIGDGTTAGPIVALLGNAS